MDPDVVDEWIRVSDRDSFLVARRLAREEGLLVGGSGGTTVWAALELAKRLGPGKTILSMLPDSGRSYLSKFYDDNWMLEHGFVERRTRAADGRAAAGGEARRGARGARPRHDLVAPEGRRGDRRHAALLDLAAARSCATAAASRSRTSSARSRTATCSTASSRIRTRCTRTSRRRCSRRSPRSRSTQIARRGLLDADAAGRTRSSSRATAGPSACSRAPTSSSTWRTSR